MSIYVPGVGSVPVRWMPASDEDYKDKSEGGRSGYQPIAIVYHRGVVNTLGSLDRIFAHGDADPATVGSPGRSVSANFGIGDIATGVAISQYVDLSDTAYCNGDCRAYDYPDQPSNWDKWYGHRGHNERTVSIEHDDNGGYPDGDPRRGIVTPYIEAVSLELTRLILSGDIAAIRAAGIRVRDQATVDALHKIIPSPKTLIRHFDIAGRNKPYCWRPWAADTVGFPQAKFIRALTEPAIEDDMPAISTYLPGYTATVKSGMRVRSAPTLSATTLRVTSSAETWEIIGEVKGDLDSDCNGDDWIVRWNGRYEYTSKCNLSSGPTQPNATEQQLAAARALGFAQGKQKATDAVQSITL